MRPFAYHRAQSVAEAISAAKLSGSMYLAGGTTLIDLAKLGAIQPIQLVDIGALRNSIGRIRVGAEGIHFGALVRMAEAARNDTVLHQYPMIAQSLHLAASQQIRNMATLGGNLLQKTRCPYYRDTSWTACNKRDPDSGCTAIGGGNRNHAVLGGSECCIATYPGDFAQALVALDASVDLMGPNGVRTISVHQLHREPGQRPEQDTNLRQDELITGIHVAAAPWTRRSLYLKVRDRQSYEFAAASAAVALDIEEGEVRQARIALGGVATRPWRAREAENALLGRPINERSAGNAAEAAFAGAKTYGQNDFKPELGRRTLVRALLQAAALEV